MFLWLRIGCVSGGENVKQSPSNLSVHQGAKAVINCTYSDGASEYFPWYKQERGKNLRLIIYVRSNKRLEEDQRLTVLLDKNAKHLSLHIADTQPGDSAVYFCAAPTSGLNKLVFGTGTRLVVIPCKSFTP